MSDGVGVVAAGAALVLGSVLAVWYRRHGARRCGASVSSIDNHRPGRPSAHG